jgi:hypothetical protein
MDWTPHVYCPPMVALPAVSSAGLLLAWIQHERDGSWHAVVSWVRPTGERFERKVIDVPAGGVAQLEAPAAYRAVPRLTLGVDGAVRPWERPDDPP